MKKPIGVKSPSRRSNRQRASGGRGSRKDQGQGLLSRRGLLLVLGGGIAGGLIVRGWEGHSARRLSALPPRDAAEAADLPLAMEESPLPRDVHVSAAQAAAARSSLPARKAVSKVPRRVVAEVAKPVPLETAKPAAPPLAAAATAPAQARSMAAAWLRNARPFIDTGNVPAVAIVIDDLGLSAVHSRQAMALPDTVTTAIMTYAPRPEEWLARARAGRHEILVHVPMQPINPRVDPGPHALTVSLSDAEILDRLRWGLGRMDGYVGINNHMGSRFTQDRPGMHVVMEEVKSRGLLFLDSVTIAKTVGAAAARPLDVPFAERNVFLDDEETVPYVSHQIGVLEAFARRHGSAIAIGHPHPATLAVLADWVPKAASRGIRVVPLTSVLRREAARA